MYNDDRLLKNPDQVADDEDIAWATSFWFWKMNVDGLPAIEKGLFGASTKAINSLECGDSPWFVNVAKIRFSKYVNVLKAFEVNETPKESGCYN